MYALLLTLKMPSTSKKSPAFFLWARNPGPASFSCWAGVGMETQAKVCRWKGEERAYLGWNEVTTGTKTLVGYSDVPQKAVFSYSLFLTFPNFSLPCLCLSLLHSCPIEDLEPFQRQKTEKRAKQSFQMCVSFPQWGSTRLAPLSSTGSASLSFDAYLRVSPTY